MRSLLETFPEAVVAHFDGRAEPAEPRLVAELVEVREGRAVIDERHRDKQPDWTYDAEDSGQSPADRLDEKRAREAAERQRREHRDSRMPKADLRAGPAAARGGRRGVRLPAARRHLGVEQRRAS